MGKDFVYFKLWGYESFIPWAYGKQTRVESTRWEKEAHNSQSTERQFKDLPQELSG